MNHYMRELLSLCSLGTLGQAHCTRWSPAVTLRLDAKELNSSTGLAQSDALGTRAFVRMAFTISTTTVRTGGRLAGPGEAANIAPGRALVLRLALDATPRFLREGGNGHEGYSSWLSFRLQ